MKSTITALLARGFDSQLAAFLAKRGYTLNKLKQITPPNLKTLGLSDELVNEVQNGTRPPVPTETVNKLLYESRWICCICRVAHKPIILHHIKPWHKSLSHGEKNLIVLCLNCHGDVHTHRELSINITPALLHDHKKKWIEEVKADTLRARLIPSAASFGLAVWDYFNHHRILDVAHSYRIRIQGIDRYRELRRDNVITNSGGLIIAYPPQELREFNYLYDAIDRRATLFYGSLLTNTLTSLPVVDLSESWNRSTVNLLQTGSVVVFAGGWRFKRQKRTGPIKGPGQLRTGYVRKRGIRLTFDFDAWETTSSSSWGHLAGSWSCTGICVVRSIERTGKLLVVQSTALAIGTGFALPT